MAFQLPDSKKKCCGWLDYDKAILNSGLSLKDKTYYFKNRFELVFFRAMDKVFLEAAPYHRAVNNRNTSFSLLGTTLLCCAIEALGGYLLGGGKNGDRFKRFIEEYLPKWYGSAPMGTVIHDWMWEHLRNPLAHSFAIAQGGMANLQRNRFKELAKGKMEIHIEPLYKDFKKAFAKYLLDVQKAYNPALVRNFEKRFEEVFIKA